MYVGLVPVHLNAQCLVNRNDLEEKREVALVSDVAQRLWLGDEMILCDESPRRLGLNLARISIQRGTRSHVA